MIRCTEIRQGDWRGIQRGAEIIDRMEGKWWTVAGRSVVVMMEEVLFDVDAHVVYSDKVM